GAGPGGGGPISGGCSPGADASGPSGTSVPPGAPGAPLGSKAHAASNSPAAAETRVTQPGCATPVPRGQGSPAARLARSPGGSPLRAGAAGPGGAPFDCVATPLRSGRTDQEPPARPSTPWLRHSAQGERTKNPRRALRLRGYA